MNAHFRLPLALTVTGFLLHGCSLLPSESDGESGNQHLERGTFEAHIEGYATHSFQGEAVFETLYGLGNEPIFFLRLRDVKEPGEDYRIIDFIHSRHTKPDVGTYTLADLERSGETNPSKIWGTYGKSDLGWFKSTGGTLRIRSASENVLKGSFDFPAYEWLDFDDGTSEKVRVHVTGTFYAEKGSVGIILD